MLNASKNLEMLMLGAWASAGEGKNSIFWTFLVKNSIFLLFFRQKVGSCPPLKVFALP
jgi:hypothetical protein